MAGCRAKRWVGVVCGGLVWLALAALPCGGAEDARALYKEGLRTFRAGNPDAAIALFQRSAAADPTYAYPVFALARLFQERFEQDVQGYEDAARGYERVAAILREKPPGPAERSLYQALYFQGLLYLKGGEYDRAIETLRSFLALYPEFGSLENVHNAVGIALYYQNQYDKAVESFRRALEAKPDYPEARFNLRSVFTRLAVYNEAMANARAWNVEAAFDGVAALKEFAPRFLPGRRLEANLLLKVGRIDDAMGVLGEILALDPTHPLTYGVRMDLAKLVAGRGDRERAVALLRENLDRFPDTPEKQKQDVARMIEGLGGMP